MNNFNVKLPTGNMTRLDVPPSESIIGIKMKIYDKQGIPPENQRLAFDDEELPDWRLLGFYNNQIESTVRLELKHPGDHDMQLFVKTQSGKTGCTGKHSLESTSNKLFLITTN